VKRWLVGIAFGIAAILAAVLAVLGRRRRVWSEDALRRVVLDDLGDAIDEHEGVAMELHGLAESQPAEERTEDDARAVVVDEAHDAALEEHAAAMDDTTDPYGPDASRALLLVLLTLAALVMSGLVVGSARGDDAPRGVWPTSSGDVSLLCPVAQVYEQAAGRPVKVPRGCVAGEAGLWRSVEVDARLYADLKAIIAERDALRVDLATARAKLLTCRQWTSTQMLGCVEDLRTATGALEAVTACDCHPYTTAAAACAACGAAAGLTAWATGD